MINLFKHLLPRSKAFFITPTKTLRDFFEGLAPSFQAVVDAFDLTFLDMFPSTTRHITQWEEQFGAISASDFMTEDGRRDRLAALWAAKGGQDPRYIQDTLQDNGFDVYVYDWWELPRTDPPVAINPFEVLGTELYGAGDPVMECGEPLAECGNYPTPNGYMLVNKLYTAETDYTVCCGEPLAECGEPTAECGENDGIIFTRTQYPIPNDPALWPYIIYFGGSPLGTQAIIPEDRREEFEDLVLKMCPLHLWIGLVVDYAPYVVEDASGDVLFEDASGDILLEA